MAQQAKKFSRIQRIVLIASIALFVLLAVSQTVPLSYGSTGQYIYQASLQLARSNGFAKNVLVLQYGMTDQQTQALSDMQVSLPLFVDEQNTLLRSNQQDTQTVLQQARSDYLALVVAVTTVINHTESLIDPKQVAIIEANSRAFDIIMNQCLLILQNQANDWNVHLVLFQEIITALLAVCFVWLRFLGRRC